MLWNPFHGRPEERGQYQPHHADSRQDEEVQLVAGGDIKYVPGYNRADGPTNSTAEDYHTEYSPVEVDAKELGYNGWNYGKKASVG